MFVYHFVNPKLRVDIIFRKERTAENEEIDFEIVDIDTSAYWVLVHEPILFLTALGEQNITWVLVTSGCRLSRKV